MAKTPCKTKCEQYTNAITTAFMIDLMSGKMGDAQFFTVIESLSKNMDEGRTKVELGLEMISEISKQQGGGQYLDNARMMEGVIMSYATNDPIYLQQFVNIAKQNATQGTRGKYLSDSVDMQTFVSKFALSISSFDITKTINEQVMKNKIFQDLFKGVSTENIAKGLKSLNVFNYTSVKELNRYGVSLMKNFDDYTKNKDQFSPDFYSDMGKNFDEQIKKDFDEQSKGKTPEEKSQLFVDLYNRNLKNIFGSSIDDPFLKSTLESKFADGKDNLPTFNAVQNYMLFRTINSGIPEADAMAKLLDSMGVIKKDSGDILENFNKGISEKLPVSDLRSIIFNNIEGFQKLSQTQKIDLMERYKDAIQNEIFKNTGDLEKLSGREREVVKTLSSLTADFSVGKDVGESLTNRLYKAKIKKYNLGDLAKNNPNLKEDILKQLLGETQDDMFESFDMTELEKQLMMIDILGVDPQMLDEITGAIDIVRYVSQIDGVTDNLIGEVQAIVTNFLEVSDELKKSKLSPEGFSIKYINDLSNKRDELANKVQSTISFLQSYNPDGGKYYPQRKILQAFFGSPVTTDNIVIVDTNPLLGQGDDVSIARKKLYMLSQRYELNLPMDDVPVLELTDSVTKSAKKLFDYWKNSLDGEPVSFLLRQKRENDPVMDRFYKMRDKYISQNQIQNQGSVSSPDYGLSLDFENGLLKIKSANKFDIDNRVGQLEYVRNLLTDSKSVIGEQDNVNELDTAMNAYLQTLFGDMDIKNFDQIKTTLMGEDGKSFVDIDTLMKRVNVLNQKYSQAPVDLTREYDKIVNLSDNTVGMIIPDFVQSVVDETGISIGKSVSQKFDVQKVKEYMFAIIYGGVEKSYPAKLGMLEELGLITAKEVEIYKISPNSIRDELLYRLDKALPELRIPYDYNDHYRSALNYVIDNYETIQPQLSTFGETTKYSDLPPQVQSFIQSAFPKNYAMEGLDETTSNDQKAQLVLSRIASAFSGIREQVVKFSDGIEDIKGIQASVADNNYKSIIDGDALEKRQSITYAQDAMFDNVDRITNDKVSGKPLKTLISDIKSLLSEYKSSLKSPASYDDIMHNKAQQNIFKSKLYNLQVQLASEYAPLYPSTSLKNTFFYYENTIPFVPDVSTYNAVDTYIDNMKGTFDKLQEDIQSQIDEFNKKPKTFSPKDIVSSLLNKGYITIVKDGVINKVTRTSAIKSSINKIISGLSYVKEGDSSYIDSLLEIFRKDENFIERLSDAESKRLYAMISMSEFAAKVNDPLFLDITNHIKKQARGRGETGPLDTFFDEYVVENGLPRIMNTPILQGDSIIKEMQVKKNLFAFIQGSLKRTGKGKADLLFVSKTGSYDPIALQTQVKKEISKVGGFTNEETQLLYDNLTNIIAPYPILQRSDGIELLYNDKKLYGKNDLVRSLQESKELALLIRGDIVAGAEKQEIVDFLKGIDIGNENYSVNMGEFFDNMDVSAANAEQLARETGKQGNGKYLTFDFVGKYIDGTQPKEQTFFTKQESDSLKELYESDKKIKDKKIQDLSCFI